MVDIFVYVGVDCVGDVVGYVCVVVVLCECVGVGVVFCLVIEVCVVWYGICYDIDVGLD